MIFPINILKILRFSFIRTQNLYVVPYEEPVPFLHRQRSMSQPEQYNGLFGLPCLVLLFTHWLLHYLCLSADWHLMGFWNTQKQQPSTSAVYCVNNILFTNTLIPRPHFIKPAQYTIHFITCICGPSPKHGLPISPSYAFYLLCRPFYCRLCWLKLQSAGCSA